MKRLIYGLLCSGAFGCGASTSTGPASGTPAPTTVTAHRPITPDHPVPNSEPADRSNTGVNVRDRRSDAKTSFDQNENQADITITADIRKRVLETKMSVNAQNVKIITQNGKVTLRGPVQTADEKQAIESIAMEVAGNDKVDNLLEVNDK